MGKNKTLELFNQTAELISDFLGIKDVDFVKNIKENALCISKETFESQIKEKFNELKDIKKACDDLSINIDPELNTKLCVLIGCSCSDCNIKQENTTNIYSFSNDYDDSLITKYTHSLPISYIGDNVENFDIITKKCFELCGLKTLYKEEDKFGLSNDFNLFINEVISYVSPFDCDKYELINSTGLTNFDTNSEFLIIFDDNKITVQQQNEKFYKDKLPCIKAKDAIICKNIIKKL